MCSLLAARNRPREGRGFWWAFSLGGHPGSSECQPQVNKCVIDVGTAPVSPREAPSAFFFSLFRWALWLVCVCVWGGCSFMPPVHSPLSSKRTTPSQEWKGLKRDKRYPRRRIRFNFGSFLLPAMFHFLPTGVIALPTRREVGIRCRGSRGGGVQEMSPFVSWFAWMLAQNGR